MAKKNISRIVLAIFAFLGMAFIACRYYLFRQVPQTPLRKIGETIDSDPALKHGLASSLKKGYAAIPFLDGKAFTTHVKALECFFSLPDDALKQLTVKDEIEIGYASLPSKKSYMIRHQQVPKELNPLIDYAAKTHQVALDILTAIEKEMGCPPGTLLDKVSKTALPFSEKSPSVLRLFSYHPSIEEGCSAAAHQDLGLLTIIPRSQVPALKVLDDSGEKSKWVDVENQAKDSEAVVLVGETLRVLTEGKYISATHRVVKRPLRRFSIVYQLRADPAALIQWNGARITMEQWLKEQRAQRISVNGSY